MFHRYFPFLQFLQQVAPLQFPQKIALALFTSLTLLTACDTSQPPSAIYLAVEMNSPEELFLSRSLLYEMSRKTNPYQWMIVDTLEGQEVGNLFSAQASRRAVQEVMDSLEPKSSSDRALIQAFKRLIDLAEQNVGQRSFYAYILTSGTQDSSTLNAIHTLCKDLAQQNISDLHIYVLGLTPENRIKLSTALNPVRDQVQFAGTADSEWMQLVQQY